MILRTINTHGEADRASKGNWEEDFALYEVAYRERDIHPRGVFRHSEGGRSRKGEGQGLTYKESELIILVGSQR